jgi:hypothetical protein
MNKFKFLTIAIGLVASLSAFIPNSKAKPSTYTRQAWARTPPFYVCNLGDIDGQYIDCATNNFGALCTVQGEPAYPNSTYCVDGYNLLRRIF